MENNENYSEELRKFMNRSDTPPSPVKGIIGFVIVLAVLIFLIFKVFFPPIHPIVGVWAGEGMQGQGLMEFTKDGELIMSDAGMVFMKCKYETDGDELIMIIDSSSFAGLLGESVDDMEETRGTATFEIRNNKLFITTSLGETSEFTRYKKQISFGTVKATKNVPDETTELTE